MLYQEPGLEPPTQLPEYDPNVLLALREMHSHDPSVFTGDPLYLEGMLKDEGYLDYWPSLVTIGASIELLEIELLALLEVPLERLRCKADGCCHRSRQAIDVQSTETSNGTRREVNHRRIRQTLNTQR